MRASVICVVVFAAATVAHADEREDRAAIERAIRALSDDLPGTAQKRDLLFTADAQAEFDRLSKLNRQLREKSDAPWSEVTSPRIVIQSVRFIARDVALVDATNTQYGSVILVRRIPMLFVMKKRSGWRIASVRVLADWADLNSDPPEQLTGIPVRPNGR